jgi:hypothetical protein
LKPQGHSDGRLSGSQQELASCSLTASRSPRGIEKGQDGAPRNPLQGTDYQSVTNIMGELQSMEAKQADFNHMISKNEAKIDRKSKEANQKD